MNKKWLFYAYLILSILAVLLLVLKVITQFYQTDQISNQQLTLGIFALLGLAYVLYSRELNGLWRKGLLLSCGTYLILYSWIPYWEHGYVTALACVFLPAFLVKRKTRRRRSSRFDQSDQG